MCVHDVEGRIGERQGIGVTDAELQRRHGGAPCRLGDHRLGAVDTDRGARGHQRREIAGDGARTATDVEQRQPGRQVVEEVGRRVRRGSLPMGSEHTVVVPVGVDLAVAHAPRMRDGP